VERKERRLQRKSREPREKEAENFLVSGKESKKTEEEEGKEPR